MRVLIEGWDSGEPVRALLDAPDASQVRAAERVTLQFGDASNDASTTTTTTTTSGAEKTTTPSSSPPPLNVLLAQQPHLLTKSPPLLSAVVWDCGLALAEWLIEKEGKKKRREVEEGNGPERRGPSLSIVELGAGAGAPGLAAAASGLASAVLLTDVQQSLRGMRVNVTRNRLAGKVAVAELDWSSSEMRSRGAGGGGSGSAAAPFDVSSSSSGLFASDAPIDLVLSADVCYPPPPSKTSIATEEEVTAEAEASAVAWAEAAASLCGRETRVLVAFEQRPGGVPGPEALRSILLREARERFERVDRLDAGGMAFAGAANLELYEFSGCKK